MSMILHFLITHLSEYVSSEIEFINTHVELWCKNNKMQINEAKTQIMTISKKRSASYDNIQLGKSNVTSLKILGLKLNNNLRWDEHIDSVIAKCSQRLYIL